MSPNKHQKTSKALFGKSYKGFHRYLDSGERFLGPFHRLSFPHTPIGILLYAIRSGDNKVFLVGLQHALEDLIETLEYLDDPRTIEALRKEGIPALLDFRRAARFSLDYEDSWLNR